MTRDAEELAYRVRWRAGDVHAGSHRSRTEGAGDEFRGVTPLTQGRDARRIDLRASVRDPWERPWVREFRQRSRISVMLLADLSRSMQFVGHADRLQLVGQFARALAAGAARRGDPFGFIGCDRAVRRSLMMLPMRSRRAGEIVARQLEALRRPEAAARDDKTGDREHNREHGAEGLAQAARWLPQRRSLVFLFSDLYLDAALFERVLKSLVLHDVVVVLLADSAERQPPARWGLARLADLETGRERLVFLRPGVAERMAAGQAERTAAAAQIARRHGAALLVAQDHLDLSAMARHFLSRGGT
jgi:uncharacterized protein (DUF58 family)